MDGLASNAEEGCNKRHYATASSMYALNRGFLNANSCFFGSASKEAGTRGSETSEYPQEKKSIEMLLVKAIENSIRQTECAAEMQYRCGVVRLSFILHWETRTRLERWAVECESHVRATQKGFGQFLSTARRILCRKPGAINP